MTKIKLNFSIHTCDLHGETATYRKLNSNGIKAHFYGGNGLPTPVYDELLKRLIAKYEIKSLDFRASWPNIKLPAKRPRWTTYSNDLIHFLEQNYNEPVVGIAHSQGAHANIVAAHLRPDLFKELILIDPVSVTKSQEWRIKCIPWEVKKFVQPFKNTLQKSDEWSSPKALYTHLRKNRAFKRMSNEQLLRFAEHALVPIFDEKYKLIFPSKWEAYNYALPVNIDRHVAGLKVPFRIIGGRPSLFFGPTIRKRWNKLIPKSSMLINNEYGLLLPIEAPEVCANMILK